MAVVSACLCRVGVVCYEDRYVALGCEDRQGRFDDVMLLVGDQLVQGSVYRLLADHGDALFSDEYFADLFKRSTLGRPTVPARVVATVMLLQAYEGFSDREACDRLAFDLRWKAAAGLTVGAGAFHPTVLVGMRNRLRASDRPRRLFDDVNTTARAAGLLRGRRRVLDSTPLFDAVATQDTVIQLRAAIRKVLAAADWVNPQLATAVRATLTRDDDYATLGKPPCDWDDPKAREALVDALVRDAHAALTALEGHQLDGPPAPAAELLGLVAGQDVEAGEDGVFSYRRQGGPGSADLHRRCRSPPRAQVAGADLRWVQDSLECGSRRRADHQCVRHRGQYPGSPGHRRAAGRTGRRHRTRYR